MHVHGYIYICLHVCGYIYIYELFPQPPDPSSPYAWSLLHNLSNRPCKVKRGPAYEVNLCAYVVTNIFVNEKGYMIDNVPIAWEAAPKDALNFARACFDDKFLEFDFLIVPCEPEPESDMDYLGQFEADDTWTLWKRLYLNN